MRTQAYANLSRGLSPRVRGRRQLQGHAVHLLRSIPACAGEAGLFQR